MILLKVVLVGDGGVGKTALRERFMGKGFSSSYRLTVGADFSVYQTMIDQEPVKLQIWDLAGQPRFSQVRSVYYAGTRGIVLVYDITNLESFNNTPFWIKEVLKYSNKQSLPIILIGNKADLRYSTASLQRKHGEALAREISNIQRKEPLMCKYIETSAKTGENVEEAFLELVRAIIPVTSREVDSSRNLIDVIQ